MDRRDQEALSGLTEGAAHSLATDFAKPNGTQLFVRSFLAFSLFPFVPMALKRARLVSPIEGIDGRYDASEEEEQVVVSDGEAERWGGADG